MRTKPTNELVALWRTARRLQEDDAASDEEYRAAKYAFDEAVGLLPWEASPLDVGDDVEPPTGGTVYATSWPQARQLAQRLDAMVARRK